MTATPEHLNWDENISNIRFIAWDTETTGASPMTDSLVEIAAIAFDEEFEHRRFSSLVRPTISIPYESTRIHGINDEMVKQAPDSLLAMTRFFEFLEWSGNPRVLLAHNAAFDIGIFNGELRRRAQLGKRGISKDTMATLLPEVVLDTCMLAKALLTELPQHRLESLANHFELEKGRLHRAMEDVKVLKEVFLKLLEISADRFAERGKEFTLKNVIDIAGGYFVLDPKAKSPQQPVFHLSPRISALEALCGTESKVAIAYDSDDYRYITPIAVRVRAFKVYIEAICHRENIKKTFRADKILHIGRVDDGS